MTQFQKLMIQFFQPESGLDYGIFLEVLFHRHEPWFCVCSPKRRDLYFCFYDWGRSWRGCRDIRLARCLDWKWGCCDVAECWEIPRQLLINSWDHLSKFILNCCFLSCVQYRYFTSFERVWSWSLLADYSWSYNIFW